MHRERETEHEERENAAVGQAHILGSCGAMAMAAEAAANASSCCDLRCAPYLSHPCSRGQGERESHISKAGEVFKS